MDYDTKGMKNDKVNKNYFNNKKKIKTIPKQSDHTQSIKFCFVAHTREVALDLEHHWPYNKFAPI